MHHKKSGLLFGILMGTLLGVLFAPRKGKELRGQLKKEIEQGGIGADTLRENFLEMGQDIATTAQEISEKPEVKKTIKKSRQQAKEIFKKVQKKGNEIGDEIKKNLE